MLRLRDLSYAVLSGLLLASTFPPFQLEALAWIALVPLIWSFDSKLPLQSFVLGFLTGFIASAIIIWWVKVTMVTYGGLTPWLASFITVLLAAYMAVYIGIFGYLLTWIAKDRSSAKLFLAAPLWVTLELLRAYAFSGFPWALLGYSQYRVLPVIQIADLVGVYGISFFVMLVNAGLWHIFRHPQRNRFAVGSGLVATTILVIGYGYFRLYGPSEKLGIPVRPIGIIQGNTNPSVKWEPGHLESIVVEHESLTMDLAKAFRPAQTPVPPLIVWPEAALPVIYEKKSQWEKRMQEVAKRTKSYLLFGALGVTRQEKEAKLHSSAFLLSPSGEDLGRYDKNHLVPFGEYVPFEGLLFFVKKLVPIVGSFTAGKEAKVFDIPGGKFGVLICFDAVFPRVVRQFKNAQFLVNITNDAWFGRTAATEQHLAIVALRAVELRIPIVRAANTGISSIIDANGAIRVKSPLFTQWSWKGVIAPRIGGPTIYAQVGDAFALACAITIIIAGVISITIRKVFEEKVPLHAGQKIYR